jgi:hypothetical protein
LFKEPEFIPESVTSNLKPPKLWANLPVFHEVSHRIFCPLTSVISVSFHQFKLIPQSLLADLSALFLLLVLLSMGKLLVYGSISLKSGAIAAEFEFEPVPTLEHSGCRHINSCMTVRILLRLAGWLTGLELYSQSHQSNPA